MAGVAAIIAGKEGILLVKRDKDPGKGLWSIPGGVIKIGEPHRDAVVREALEETGIEVELLELADVVDVILPDMKGQIEYHGVLVVYFARPLAGEPRPENYESEVRWVKQDELSSIELHPLMKHILVDHERRISTMSM